MPVRQPAGLGVDANTFNVTTFAPVKTSRLRLEVAVAKGAEYWNTRMDASTTLDPCHPLHPSSMLGSIDQWCSVRKPTFLEK